MRNPSRSTRSLVFVILLALAIPAAVAVLHVDPATAISLPQSCDDLIHGDCDNTWMCVVACYMELWGLEDFCSQYPNSPRCM